MSNSSKMHPSNEAIKMQMTKIAADGNRPQDWKTYIDEVRLKAHGVDESKRNLILSYLYYSAFKVIPKTSKSLAHAQMLVDYASIKSVQSVADADNLLSYGRSHLRQFAIVHIASAELALKMGNKEQARKFIKSAYFHGAEPTFLIKEAAKRLCKGFHQLLCNQDKDSSSSSGHESSEPELSGECSGSYFKATLGSKHQEHSTSNLPGLKYDTKELQEGLDLFSTIKESDNDMPSSHLLKNGDEDPEHTSPMKTFDNRDEPTSPVMPKTPKTPAFSSQFGQRLFKMKRCGDSTYKHAAGATEENVMKQSSMDVVNSDESQPISESHKVLKENSNLLNWVTPSVKKKVEGVSDSVSLKMNRSSSVSKLKNVALQPPRRVKVDSAAKRDFDEEEEKEVNSMNTANDAQFQGKASVRKSLQDGLLSTPASKTISASDGTASKPLPFANQNTYSVHKTTKILYDDPTKNQCDSEVPSLRTNAVDRKLFGDDHISSQKVPNPEQAQNVISNQLADGKAPLKSNRSEPSHVPPQQPDQPRHDIEANPQSTRKEANNIGISNEQRDRPQQQSVLPQNILAAQQPAQSGQKVIYVNNKTFIVTRLIGRGGSAKVFLVQDPDTFEMKALKRVDLSGASPQILESYKNEIALLKKLQACDCVIRLYDSEYDQCKKKLLVVMEYGETDLANFIAKNGSIKNQDELYPVTVCYWWGCMVKAVRAMHKEGVIHSDLKPANFILVSGNIKLIDFGIANSIQQDMTSMLKDHTVGTPSYMSPEALMANNNTNPNERKPLYKIGFKSDVWSLGCILYQMVYGQTPFQGCRHKLEAIVNPAHVINFPPTNDAALTDILQKCLTRDVKTRPTTEDLMMHPYLTKQRAETTAVNDPISRLMSEGASIATASPRSQQAFCVKFQKAMEQMNSSKKS